MSVLVADIGNTRLKWARVVSGGDLEPGQAHAYPAEERPLGQLLAEAWGTLEPPQRVVVASVAADEVDAAVSRWAEARWRVRPELLVAVGQGWGVTSAYNKPEKLGVDRFAALVAAHRAFTGAVLIVDCGTAVTVDALAPGGRHLGGLIVPGMDLMAGSLLTRTRRIREAGTAAVPGFAGATGDAVRAGATLAVAALVERSRAELSRLVDGGITVVVTGGGAQALRPALNLEAEFNEDLVLRGVAIMACEQS